MAYMEGFLSLDYDKVYTREDHWMFNYPKTREFSRLYLLDLSINVMAPYYAHHLMNGIADELEKAAQGTSTFKLSLFSYHDLNLLSVLRAVGYRGKATDPLAVMAFELWKDHNGYRVALRMSEGVTTDWQYKPDGYLKILKGGEEIRNFPDVVTLLRTSYQSQLNLTDCGYFGSDAKL